MFDSVKPNRERLGALYVPATGLDCTRLFLFFPCASFLKVSPMLFCKHESCLNFFQEKIFSWCVLLQSVGCCLQEVGMANYIRAQVSSRKGDKIVLRLIHSELDEKERTVIDHGPAFLEFPLNEESTAFLAECDVYENETATIQPDGDGLFDLRCLIQKGKVLERKK